ncbi:chaperone protein HtpG [Photobacterium aphoticum]|uniref:Chaperone protein HtpG n=1 Tax=Photobacterium aphoticum TaxID=754436 RepID=A0A090QTD3_9GAMM|nr:chaperone protein HtpG [Photobacterium aphoticum]
MITKMADEADEEVFGRWVEMLLGQAMLAEKGSMDDPSVLGSRQ